MARSRSSRRTSRRRTQAGVLAAIHQTLQTHEPCRLEYRLPGRSEREERWFEALVTVVVEDGAAVQMLGLCRDVTEHLRVNREVRVRARQQETLARLGERALTESDLQKFFNEVVTTVGEILDVEMVKILELLPGDAELLLRAGIGWKAGLVGHSQCFDRPRHAGRLHACRRPAGDRRGSRVGDEILRRAAAARARRRQRAHHADRGTRWPRLRRARRAYRQAAQVQRLRRLVSRGGRERGGGSHPAPATRSASRTDDPRAAAPLRQSVFAAARSVLADRQEFAQRRRSRGEIRGARSGAGQCASPHHRRRLEINLAQRASQHAACAIPRSHLVQRTQRLPRARSDLRAEHGGARARDQCQQARQPFRARPAASI